MLTNTHRLQAELEIKSNIQYNKQITYNLSCGDRLSGSRLIIRCGSRSLK